jgi:hypothetical protein
MRVLQISTLRERTGTQTTARGFEPLRVEPNAFLVHQLNHSVTLSCRIRLCLNLAMREANTVPQGPPATVNDDINLRRLRRASVRRPLTEHVRGGLQGLCNGRIWEQAHAGDRAGKPDAACNDGIQKWSVMSAPLPGAQHTIPPYILSARLSLDVTASLATVVRGNDSLE